MPKFLPSGQLYRLIYYSRNMIRQSLSHEAFEAEIRTLLNGARLRNEAEHLSGCLMCSVSGFAQVLEGTRDGVERAFDRIFQDARHTDVSMLSLTPITQPSFPGFPLALAWAADDDAPDPLRHLFDEPIGGGPRATTGSDVLKLLQAAVGAMMLPPRQAAYDAHYEASDRLGAF